MPARRSAALVIVAEWVIAADSATAADSAIETDSAKVDSATVVDWANEENLVPEAKTEGNVFNRRPTIVGNRGTIGLAKIRTG